MATFHYKRALSKIYAVDPIVSADFNAVSKDPRFAYDGKQMTKF